MKRCSLCKRLLWRWQKRVEKIGCHERCLDIWSKGFAAALKGSAQAQALSAKSELLQ